MRADELAVLGMPVYRDKRSLVEAVVEAVAGLMSGSGEALTLIQALQSLIGDGLRPDFHIWTVVVAVTGQGILWFLETGSRRKISLPLSEFFSL